MSKKDYTVLGLPENADEKAIKRAYFKLVRQFSPEKDPERFQEIREAYENLTSGKKDNISELMLEVPDEPYAKKIIKWMQEAMLAGDSRRMVKMAEEAISVYGEAEGFLFYLYRGLNMSGKTGKAVKTIEKLVKKFPDKPHYKKELALSYLDRGYYNKALAAFREAYKEGIRDNDFLSAYAINCHSRGEYQEGLERLWELLDNAEKNLKENMMDALEAFAGLFMINSEMNNIQAQPPLIERFCTFIDHASLYMDEYEEDFIQIAGHIMMAQKNYETPDFDGVILIVNKIRSSLSNEKNSVIWEELLKCLHLFNKESDERLSDFTKEACEVMEPDDEEPDFRRFMQLDIQLRLLEKWPAIKGEFEIVRDEYPDSYKFIKDYIELLDRTNDIDYLREKLLKDYNRYAAYYDGLTPYYEEYPHRQPKAGEIQWDSEENGSYRRQNKKIGRNDPCPCGSGKKYKNCCGR